MGIDKICVVHNALEIQLVRNEAKRQVSNKIVVSKKRHKENRSQKAITLNYQDNK